MLTYFVFFYFMLMAVISYRGKKWRIVSYIFAVYAFSAFFSIILQQTNIEYQKASLFPTILYCTLLTMFFIPYWKNPPQIRTDTSPKFVKRFCRISYLISGTLIIGCLLFLSKLRETIAYGLIEVRSDMYRGESLFTHYTILEHIGNSIVRWLGGLSYSILIMFFYAVMCIPGKKVMKFLLFLSSLSMVYLGLMNGGRTNMMYWILFFLFCSVLFWPNMSERQRTIILNFSFVFLGLVGVIFTIITLGRAEMSHSGDTQNFLLVYVGQPYLNFCEFVDNFDSQPYTLRRIFPLTSSIFDGRFDLNAFRDNLYLKSGMNIGVFYTLLGDFFVDMGFVGMFGYTFFYYVVARSYININKNVLTLSNLLFLGVLIEIPLHGLFYYSMYKMEVSAAILVLFIMIRYLRVK